jgi:hypothetical protein
VKSVNKVKGQGQNNNDGNNNDGLHPVAPARGARGAYPLHSKLFGETF